jgi:hypothetical protein
VKTKRSPRPAEELVPGVAVPAEVERWFVRRGLPALSPYRRRRGHVWRRGLPALLANLAYWALVCAAPVPSEAWVELLVFGAAIVLLWVGMNVLRHRRPLAAPVTIGWVELAAFVLVPATVFAGSGAADWLGSELLAEGVTSTTTVGWFVGVAVFQVVYLVVVRVLVGLGIFALATWLLRQLASSVVAFSTALSRTLPLLLGVVAFFLYAAEIWQAVGRQHAFNYTLLLLIFVGLGALFTGSREHFDIDSLRRFESAAALRAAVADFECLGVPDDLEFPIDTPLGRRQRFNLRLVAVAGRLVVAVVVAIAVGLTFFVIGMVSIDSSVVKAWTLAEPTRILRIGVPGGEWLVSWELLKVAGFLATFSGFYFAVVSSVDPALRAGITDTSEDAVREGCAARVLALHAVSVEVPDSGRAHHRQS